MKTPRVEIGSVLRPGEHPFVLRHNLALDIHFDMLLKLEGTPGVQGPSCHEGGGVCFKRIQGFITHTRIVFQVVIQRHHDFTQPLSPQFRSDGRLRLVSCHRGLGQALGLLLSFKVTLQPFKLFLQLV
jgi:hypothetical protein